MRDRPCLEGSKSRNRLSGKSTQPVFFFAEGATAMRTTLISAGAAALGTDRFGRDGAAGFVLYDIWGADTPPEKPSGPATDGRGPPSAT